MKNVLPEKNLKKSPSSRSRTSDLWISNNLLQSTALPTELSKVVVEVILYALYCYTAIELLSKTNVLKCLAVKHCVSLLLYLLYEIYIYTNNINSNNNSNLYI